MDYYHFEMIHTFPRRIYLDKYKDFDQLFTLIRILNCSRELFLAPRSISPGNSQS